MRSQSAADGWVADVLDVSEKSCDVRSSRRSVRRVIETNTAQDIACKLLKHELPLRWAHTKGVSRGARSLARILGEDAKVVESAAWLHDIGYAQPVASTGFHSLDGARYLRDVLRASPLLCQLVAHHTGARVEAEERAIPALASEFPLPPVELLDALTYCDLTAGVDGAPISVDDRLEEILIRYPAGHVVHQSITRSSPFLRESARSIQDRLAAGSVEVRSWPPLKVVVNAPSH